MWNANERPILGLFWVWNRLFSEICVRSNTSKIRMNIANNSPRSTAFRMGTSVRDFGSKLRPDNAAFVVFWCVLIFSKFSLVLLLVRYSFGGLLLRPLPASVRRAPPVPAVPVACLFFF